MRAVLFAIACALVGCDHGAPPPAPRADDAELSRRIDALTKRLDEVIDALAHGKTDEDRAALRARLEQMRAETKHLISGPDCENPLAPDCM